MQYYIQWAVDAYYDAFLQYLRAVDAYYDAFLQYLRLPGLSPQLDQMPPTPSVLSEGVARDIRWQAYAKKKEEQIENSA